MAKSKRDFWGKFYYGDWRKDAKLARCGWAAKGALMDFLAFVFESDEPGYAVEDGEALTLEDIALTMTGDPREYVVLLEVLLKQKILLRDDRGAVYSKRMAHEHHVKTVRSAAGGAGGQKTQDLLKQNANQNKGNTHKQTSNSNSISNSSNSSSKKEDEIAFPEPLDTDAFKQKWVEWFAYRSESGLPKWKPRTITSQLKELAQHGHETAITAIDLSIRNGWRGLFPDKAGGKGGGAAGQTPQARAQARRAEQAAGEYCEDLTL